MSLQPETETHRVVCEHILAWQIGELTLHQLITILQNRMTTVQANVVLTNLGRTLSVDSINQLVSGALENDKPND